MAVLERTTNRSKITARQDELTATLLNEWHNPSELPGSEPLIIVESEALGEPAKHIYVVWSTWEDLTPLQRSGVIMRAYEQYLGADASLISHLTLAMGLLPDEAKIIGIEL